MYKNKTCSLVLFVKKIKHANSINKYIMKLFGFIKINITVNNNNTTKFVCLIPLFNQKIANAYMKYKVILK